MPCASTESSRSSVETRDADRRARCRIVSRRRAGETEKSAGAVVRGRLRAVGSGRIPRAAEQRTMRHSTGRRRRFDGYRTVAEQIRLLTHIGCPFPAASPSVRNRWIVEIHADFRRRLRRPTAGLARLGGTRCITDCDNSTPRSDVRGRDEPRTPPVGLRGIRSAPGVSGSGQPRPCRSSYCSRSAAARRRSPISASSGSRPCLSRRWRRYTYISATVK